MWQKNVKKEKQIKNPSPRVDRLAGRRARRARRAERGVPRRARCPRGGLVVGASGAPEVALTDLVGGFEGKGWGWGVGRDDGGTRQ